MGCIFHKWDGCKCSKCGKIRETGHVYRYSAKTSNAQNCVGICEKCGLKFYQTHDMQPVPGKCFAVCTRCGFEDVPKHTFASVPGECRQKCSVCGAPGEIVHTWVPVEGKCEERCSVCGETREKHDYVDGKCTRCGRIDRQGIMDECLEALLGIFPTTPLDYEGHKKFDAEYREDVRRIGERLNVLGGMSAMRQVGEAFARKNPLHARKLETTWDGIGMWMG